VTLVPSPRDAVLLKTVYKSPTTAHIFSFSADEPSLFSNIPPIEANTIRTQVDLQGFAIEALSPTTTLLTLLEQSDPKGWTNKTSIPQQMITTLAGIGEFAIKCGGPPVATRLAGAKTTEIRYDHERMSFRIEYEVSAVRRPLLSPEITPSNSRLEDERSSSSSTPIAECELRCDMDTWAFSLDIVVDPPPQSVSCLRRHRLSSGGGGLWLTLTHDAILAGEERLMAIVRRGPGRERKSSRSASKNVSSRRACRSINRPSSVRSAGDAGVIVKKARSRARIRLVQQWRKGARKTETLRGRAQCRSFVVRWDDILCRPWSRRRRPRSKRSLPSRHHR
jgi:hypothetical protein